MKFKKTLIIGINESKLTADYWSLIGNLTQTRIMLSKDSPEISNHIKTADCLLVNFGVKVDKEMIDNAPNLKYIGALATAYNKIDSAYAASKGIAVCNIPDYSTEAVAEFAFAVILEYIRDLERAKKQAREGNYSESTFFHVYEIKGKKFGIVGLGSIGRRVAEIALGFGADVRYWSRTRKPEYEAKGIKYQEAEKLLTECDFISLNLAHTKETEHFLDNKRISKIKKGAVVINLAPMELVDISALANRLEKGDIIFILDHSDELSPEQAKQLAKYKNCIIYPPIAYTTKEATLKKQDVFVGNIENFLRGIQKNKVN